MNGKVVLTLMVLLLALGIGVRRYLTELEEVEPTARVEARFNEKFPTADDVERRWESTGYAVEFFSGGISYTAIVSYSGEILSVGVAP